MKQELELSPFLISGEIQDAKLIWIEANQATLQKKPCRYGKIIS